MFWVLGYFVLMIGVSCLFHKRVDSLEDFFVTGRKLPVWLVTPTILATWFGAGSFMGVTATVYEEGIGGVIADPFGVSISLIIAALFFAGPLRKKGLITINEVIKESYGPTLEKISSWATLPFYIGTLASQIIAMGLILDSFFEIPFSLGIVFVTVVVTLYTFVGGMWSVTVTDGLQLLIFLAAILALFVPFMMDGEQRMVGWELAKNEVGGLLPKSDPHHGFLSYLGMWLMTGFGALMGQDLVQRFFSCRDEGVAKKSGLLAALFYLLLGLIPCFLGLMGRHVAPDLTGNELIPFLVKQQSPFVVILFIWGILSITMSTADSYLLAGSAILSKDILGVANHEVKKARLSMVILAIVAYLISMFTQNIYGLMVHSGVFLFLMLFVPVTAALYSKKVYPISGWFSMGGGFFAWLGYILFHYEQIFVDLDALLYAAASCGGAASLMCYVVGHYASEKLLSDSLTA